MADELANNQVKVRFMAQFDAMYARDWPAERLLTLESQINPQPFQLFTELIREGIADGSLRADLDPDLTMHAVINAVIGAQRRLASLGNKIEQEYGQPHRSPVPRNHPRDPAGIARARKLPARRIPKNQKAGKVQTRKRSS